MIKTVYISNVLECYHKTYSQMAPKQKHYWVLHDILEGNRALFYGQDKKAVLTTRPIDTSYLDYVMKLMGWNQVVNLYPKPYTYSLSHDSFGNPALSHQLVELIRQNPGISIVPYKTTPEFNRLINYLKELELSFNTPETLPEDDVFAHTYINSKRGFRHLWNRAVCGTSIGKQVMIPQGFITTGREEALEAAWWFQAQKRSFVFKYNFGVSGSGVKIFNHHDLPGVKKEFLKRIRSRLATPLWNTPCIIVEEYIKPNASIFSGSPSIEFFIDTAGKVHQTFPCEQIFEDDGKTFCGIYIHPDLMRSKLIISAYKAGMLWGRELSQLGYRGYFDIDLVISKSGQIYAVESNLRRTGGTHTYEFARSFLGNSFLDKYFVISQDISLPKSKRYEYHQLKNLLADILIDKTRKAGVIIYNPEMLAVNKLCLFIVGLSNKEVMNYKKNVLDRLGLSKNKG